MTEKTEKEPHIPTKYRANYSYWNLMRTITITQATYLTMGIEPDTDIRSSIIKHRFDEILNLANSWTGSEILPCTNFYWTEVLPAVWLKWLKHFGIDPPEQWDPIDVELIDDTTYMAAQIKRQAKDTVHWKRRGELLSAAKKGLEFGELAVQPTIKELLSYMKDGDYPNCNNATYDAIQKSIEKTGAKLFDDVSYRTAVEQHAADTTDN